MMMPALLPAMACPVLFLALVLVQALQASALGISLAGIQRRRDADEVGSVPAGLGGMGNRPGGLGHWSPAALSQLWDARTLASFSVSQLDAFARIIAGRCPLLSHAVRCTGSPGQDLLPHGQRDRAPAVWRRLMTAYLDEEAELAKRHSVRIMRHFWSNYEALAFGKDELKPVSGKGVNNWGGLGQTIVDALDTLWLMDFRSEFHKAAAWVERELHFDVDVNVNTFETSIRQLGGLVSAYALSGKKMFLEKAKDLGDRLILAYAGLMPKPKAPAKAKSEVKGRLMELLESMGLPQSAMNALTGESGMESLVSAGDDLLTPQLPFSDVNLLTGEVQNLGGFVSLSEAYVPVEWKALALFTGNCTYALPQDEVLKLVNKTSELASRGFAPIMLQSDGQAYPSWENRISLGGRGDSFYEYLLKDWIWSGEEVNPLTRSLWDTFRKQLPSLLVLADPAKAATAHESTYKMAPEPRSWLGSLSGRPDTPWQTKRRRRLRQQAQDARAALESSVSAESSLPPPRDQVLLRHSLGASKNEGQCSGGACGGWHESAGDAAMPWAFLREVTFLQTVPKMDHLICFLPGTLALDVLHRGRPSDLGVRKEATSSRSRSTGSSPGNVSALPADRVAELRLAHKLMQSCVHMYFRTASDLAPEITRFNGKGLVDDLVRCTTSYVRRP
jgi:hypothetical protein